MPILKIVLVHGLLLAVLLTSLQVLQMLLCQLTLGLLNGSNHLVGPVALRVRQDAPIMLSSCCVDRVPARRMQGCDSVDVYLCSTRPRVACFSFEVKPTHSKCCLRSL